MTHDELVQLEKRHLWHPFTQMRDWEASEPLFIERGEGVKLIASDGRAYYDGNSSMWLNVHGHRKAEIDRAIIEQLGKVAHSTMLGLTHEPGALLAARLAALAPDGLSRVFYSDNGSTAIEVALKMAYQFWKNRPPSPVGRRRFIAHAEGYHGDTLGAVSVGGVGRFHSVFGDLLFEVEVVPSPSADEAASHVESLLIKYPGEFAAIVVEPLVQMAGGVLMSPPGYLKRLRELCDRHDVFLIFDEVATGFGRTGKMFACEHEGVAPDFLCLGKGLTGGYLPLAATLTTERVYQAFLGDYCEWKQFTHGHSYTGNSLACAAALANLDLFESEHIIEGLQPKIEFLAHALQEVERLDHVGAVRQCGLLVGIELVKDKACPLTPNNGGTRLGVPYAFEETMGLRVCKRARDLGLITRPLGDVVTFVPPLASTEDELREMVEIIGKAIEEETAR